MTAQPTLHPTPGQVPFFQILDGQGQPISEVELFLRDTYARRPNYNTVRTYAYAILDWYRFLTVQNLTNCHVRRSNVTDYVLHLREKVNPQRNRRTKEAPVAGSINAVTGKPYLAAGYQSSTINQRITVLVLFYDVLLAEGIGPKVHPVSRPDARARRRFHPDLPRYRGTRTFLQRQDQRLAHAVPRVLLKQIRAAVKSARDVALLECLYASAGRAAEVLAMTYGDVLWERREVLLNTKGRKNKEVVAVSSRFLEYLQLYLTERGGLPLPEDPLWLMERGPQRPLTYTALRAMLRRLNDQFGSNVSLHDFRATCAVHMAENPEIPFLAIRDHLRHANVNSTQRYVSTARSTTSILIQRHLDDGRSIEARPFAAEYDEADLTVVFGQEDK